jgi:hypothetical protein
MQAMRKEISRLTQLVQEEAPSHKEVLKTNPSSRLGEFEKHTKGFGSRYLSKYGFEKGKGLGRMKMAHLKPSLMSRITRRPP